MSQVKPGRGSRTSELFAGSGETAPRIAAAAAGRRIMAQRGRLLAIAAISHDPAAGGNVPPLRRRPLKEFGKMRFDRIESASLRPKGGIPDLAESEMRARIAPFLPALLLLSACFYGDETDWADSHDIKEAAASCGVPDLEPTEAGSGWAAYVPETVPDARKKEDCIYAELDRQGLVATR